MSHSALKKYLALQVHRYFRNNLSQLHELTYIFWECTLRCNLNCLHCGSDCTKNSTMVDMPLKDFLGAIDDIQKIVNPHHTTIGLTGGEPLMRNDLEECGQELYHRGFPWGFVTNGNLLNEKRLGSLMDAGLRVITVSLDGLEASHDWLRGTTGSFRKTIRAIQMLAVTEHLIFDVVTCVHSGNIRELPALKDLLVQLKVKKWRIFTIFPTGRAKVNQALHISDTDFVALLEFIKETRKVGLICLSYGCEGFLGPYEREVRDNFFYCRAGINVASVLADGSVSACPSMRDAYIQGNIYTDSFSEVWMNRYKMMRDRKWMKSGKCSQCPSFGFCGGNGLHLRDPLNNEVSFCHLEKINEGLKSLAQSSIEI